MKWILKNRDQPLEMEIGNEIRMKYGQPQNTPPGYSLHFFNFKGSTPGVCFFLKSSEKRFQADYDAGVSAFTHPFTLIVSLYAES